MASRAHFGGPSGLPLSAALSIIPSLPRALLARLVERAIERLDEIDEDADAEPNGDELDFNQAEDDFEDWTTYYAPGAGCPISDPGEDEHDREAVDFA